MQIGEVTAATGFSADTLRYYEKIRLLPQVTRNASGRRSYGREDLSRLAFIRRAQHMRFSLDEIKTLLQLRQQDGRARPQALKLAEQKLTAIEHTLADVQQLHAELELLVNLCRRASGDACPILKKLDAPQRDAH
jgi:DNA-binding transcriptional MerR regulator